MGETRETPAALLYGWLNRRLEPAAAAWLDEARAGVEAADGAKQLYLALGQVPRRLGKADLALGPAFLARADAARPGWEPAGWSVDQAARVLLLLTAAEAAPAEFGQRLEQICITADVGELVAIYRGLPLYPGPEHLLRRAGEGARSNMQALFEAVAHANPYPRERFPELNWNHMVLKALFIGSRLHPIQGLDARANPALAQMLVDYAHERWAAGRTVSPELWRCVGPFAEGALLDDLGRALAGGAPSGASGAALALHERDDESARSVLAQAPTLAAAIERGSLSWETLETAEG